MFLRAEHLRINEVGTGSLTTPALALRHRPRLETRHTLPPIAGQFGSLDHRQRAPEQASCSLLTRDVMLATEV